MSVACTYSASGTHRALVCGSSVGHLHIRQQSPLVSGAPRDKLGMREPPAPGVPPRADAAMHPPRACPRAHGPRCACVPVAGGGRLACSTCALPSAGQLVTAVPDAVTSCPATSCPALGIACALHGPRIRAGRGRALTPHRHCICRRARRPCSSSPAALRLAVRWGLGLCVCLLLQYLLPGLPRALKLQAFSHSDMRSLRANKL